MSKGSRNYRMTIAYDGTNYNGWQVQPNGATIQEVIQNALKILVKHPVSVIGSGRTDAGVHALGQTAHFHTDQTLNTYRFLNSLNGILPKDIRVTSLAEAPFAFHAQYSAVSKTYYYHLHLDRIENPFERLYRWHVRQKIDVGLLEDAAKLFVGTHDFKAFANEPHRGTAARDSVRTLQRLDVARQEGGVRLEFQADGFLYKMVRNIVGTLVEVASGKLPIEEISRIFAAKDRKAAGPAIPPHGLFLIKVDYLPESILQS